MTTVRYIRDTLDDTVGWNGWVEISALDQSSANVALGKPVTGNFAPYTQPFSVVTDGYANNPNSLAATTTVNPAYVVVDLGSAIDLSAINVVHHFDGGRVFQRTYTEISTDNQTWTRIFDTANSGTYAESTAGRTTTAPFTGASGTPPVAPPAPLGAGDSDVQQGSIMVRTRGIGTGKTFANLAAFQAFVNGIDCVATNQRIKGAVYESQIANGDFGPINSDESRYVSLEPASGLGFINFFNANTAENYGTQGIELTCQNTNYNPFTIKKGAIVSGFRINIIAGNYPTGLLFKDTPGTFAPACVGNRILCNAVDAIASNAYGQPRFTDNLVVRTAAVGGRLIYDSWRMQILRNTFVLAAGATATSCIYNEYGPPISGNAFYGFGSVLTHNTGAVSDNYANQAPSLATTGLIVDTVNPFFVNPTSDFRPGSALIGKGGAYSISTNDNIGSNRGLSPDVGAFQLTPAVPLPIGTVTQQSPIDGTSLTITLSTTNTPTSGKISLSPANPANGASAIGPLDLVIGTNVASITIDDLSAGNYLAPTITLTNAGGTVSVPGTVAFEVMGVGSLVYDGGGVGTGGGGTPPVVTLPAPTVTISTAPQSVMAGKTATLSGSVNLQGDATGTVTVFLDPQPSGSSVALGSANVAGATWTKQATVPPGLYLLRVVATANGQTAAASITDIRVLKLVGNFTLPAV